MIIEISQKNPSLTKRSAITRKEYKYTYRSGKKERLKEEHIKSNSSGKLSNKDMDILRSLNKKKKHSD